MTHWATAIEEIVQRARDNAAASAPTILHNDSALAPIKHPQQDFFLAQIFDAPLKDDQASMEHPMFSLSKMPDLKIRIYEHNGNTITVTPSAAGLATIWDKDILLFTISCLVEAQNSGQPIGRTVRLRARDLEYVRHGTVSILAGLDLHTGHIIARVHERHRSREFIELLKEIDAYYPTDAVIRVILDNHSAHISKESMAYLATRPGRFIYRAPR